MENSLIVLKSEEKQAGWRGKNSKFPVVISSSSRLAWVQPGHRVDVGAAEALPASDPVETEDSSRDARFPLRLPFLPPQGLAGGSCATETAARRASGVDIRAEGACSTVTQELRSQRR